MTIIAVVLFDERGERYMKEQIKKTIGVLGATGTVGKLLCNMLHKMHFEVIMGGRRLTNSMTERCVDIYDEASLKAFMSEVDVVVNCAGPTFLMGDYILKQALKLKKDYVDAFGWTNKKIEKNEIASCIVLNNGCLPGLAGVLMKYMLTTDTKAIHIWTGGREQGGYAALGDILLSSISGFGKPDCMIKDYQVIKARRDIAEEGDTFAQIPNMPEKVNIQKFLSDETVKFSRIYNVPNMIEYKVYPDVTVKNHLLEGCFKCMRAESPAKYKEIFKTLLPKVITINEGKASWFSMNIEAVDQENSRLLYLTAKDSSIITATMLAHTTSVLATQKLIPGIYWPFEILDAQKVLERLKNERIQITLMDEVYVL